MKNAKNIFIDRQIEHVRLVQDYMIFLEKNLDKLPFGVEEFDILRRAMYHDLTKFQEKFVHGFVAIAQFYENKKDGISNEGVDEKHLYDCSNLHYHSEAHHLAFHLDKGTLPSNVNICEMCCDWCANANRNGEKDYTKYFREEVIKQHEFYTKHEKEFLVILNLLNEEFSR